MSVTKGRTRRNLAGAALLCFVGASAYLAGAAGTSGSDGGTGGGAPIQGEHPGPSFFGCPECHSDLDRVFDQNRADGLRFRHEVHFSKGEADCGMCHPAQTHAPEAIRKPTMVRCFMCHGSSKRAKAPGSCGTCHPTGFNLSPDSHLASRWAGRGHGRAGVERTTCLVCHEARSCDRCHGVSMPHPAGWAKFPHVDSFFDRGAELCARCHPRRAASPDFCDRCHHPAASPKAAWIASHPVVVRSKGAADCFGCHDPETCAGCHARGEDRNTFDGDRAAAIRRQKGGSA
ncbi:MAG: cytochrome c3 family protein [Actinomycetota bacterium]